MSIHSCGAPREGEPLAVKPRRACQMLDCGITRLYELMNSGALVSFKDGGSRKITTASIRAYIDRHLEASQPEVA
jgi:hypothetical protein